MEKETKFRGERKDNGEWVYGYLFEDITPTRHLSYIIEGGSVPSVSMPTSKFIEVIPETVGQYTRLKDKNGKEIYGGDIVKFNTQSRKGLTRVVEYEDSAWSPFNDGEFIQDEMGDWFEFCDNPFEVIGDIYRNPELLKGETKCQI